MGFYMEGFQALYFSTWFLLLEAVSYRVYRVKLFLMAGKELKHSN